MALNKYIFWDLTEQAVLFQTASKASCLDSWRKAQLGHSLTYPFLPLSPGLAGYLCVSRAEVLKAAACEIHLVTLLKPKAMAMPNLTTSAVSGWAPGLLRRRATQVIAASSHVKNPS